MLSRSRLVSGTALAGVLLVLTGCTDLCRAHLGIRPDVPTPSTTPNAPENAACTQFYSRVEYSQNLQEAYHSRATQNRFWIYAAGTLGLATIAATGGLGAAGASTLTVTLVATSGGFASGFFALLDNATLADVYTISANSIADGLQKAREQVYGDPWNPDRCTAALKTLDEAVTNAQTTLERARTDAAVAALIRAKAQAQELEKLLATPTVTPTAIPLPTVTPPPSKQDS